MDIENDGKKKIPIKAKVFTSTKKNVFLFLFFLRSLSDFRVKT